MLETRPFGPRDGAGGFGGLLISTTALKPGFLGLFIASHLSLICNSPMNPRFAFHVKLHSERIWVVKESCTVEK